MRAISCVAAHYHGLRQRPAARLRSVVRANAEAAEDFSDRIAPFAYTTCVELLTNLGMKGPK